MKRVMLFLVVSALSSTTLFSMDEKQRLQQFDSSLEKAIKQINDLKSQIQELRESESSDLSEYDSSKVDALLEAADRQLHWQPTEQEVDDALKDKEMRELVEGVVDRAFTQSMQTKKIIDEFEIVEDESKPLIFVEPDGTTTWVSRAWVK